MAKLKYVRTLRNKHESDEENKRKMKSESTCCYSVQKSLFFVLFPAS